MCCTCIFAIVNNLGLSVPGVLEAATEPLTSSKEVHLRLLVLVHLQDQGLKLEPVPCGPTLCRSPVSAARGQATPSPLDFRLQGISYPPVSTLPLQKTSVSGTELKTGWAPE